MTKFYQFLQVTFAALVIFSLFPPEAAVAQPATATELESQWFRNVRQLTSKEIGLDRSGEAYFSPDIKRICFQAFPAGKTEYQIYVMNLDGSGLKMVSTGIGATTCSHFHPSGEKMIFAANHEDLREPEKPEEVEKFRPREGQHPGGPPPESAGHEQHGKKPREENSSGHPQHIQKAEHPGGHPQEAAGGKHPGGATDPKHGGGQGYAWKYFPGMDIYEYTFATGELKRLISSEGYDAECTWSPDGQHIVFASFRSGDQEIYVCDANGQNAQRITHAKGGDGGPFFSPDGQRLIYRSDRHGTGNLQIFVNNTTGTDERALTGHDVFNWCPYWHPSGKWVVFTQADFRGRPNFDLYLMRGDGSVTYRMTTDAAFDGLPVFSPDGRYLMWTSRRNGIDSPQIFMADFIGLTPDGELRAKVEPIKPGGKSE
ncbi:MAG: hypothetical protein ABIG44_06395 [Planctomycetota bacterium]